MEKLEGAVRDSMLTADHSGAAATLSLHGEQQGVDTAVNPSTSIFDDQFVVTEHLRAIVGTRLQPSASIEHMLAQLVTLKSGLPVVLWFHFHNLRVTAVVDWFDLPRLLRAITELPVNDVFALKQC